MAIEIGNILASHSYASLDEDAQNFLRNYFEHHWHYDGRGAQHTLPLTDILKQQQSLTVTLSMLASTLNHIETILLSSSKITAENKAYMEENLLFAFFILSAQQQFEMSRGLKNPERALHIEKCERLLLKLAGINLKNDQMSLNHQVQTAVNDSDKPLKYLGLVIIAPLIMSSAQRFFGQQQKDNVEWLYQEFNKNRRYWTWTSGLLTQIFTTLSPQFYHTASARNIFADNSFVMSYINWVILYAHWGIQFYSMMHHTLIGATAEERQISMTDRLLFEISQHKFAFMQDTFSIAAGLIVAFWAVVDSPYSMWAAPMACALRLLSLILAVYQFAEKQALYEKQSFQFEKEIINIEDKITTLVCKQDELQHAHDALEAQQTEAIALYDDDALDINGQLLILSRKQQLIDIEQEMNTLTIHQTTLNRHLQMLYKHKHKYNIDWFSKKNEYALDIALATGMLTGAMMIACAFFPPLNILPAMATLLDFIGISLCFISTVTYTGLHKENQIAFNQRSHETIRVECSLLLLQFQRTDDDNERRLLYLEMHQLQTESLHLQRLLHYQQMEVIHTICVQFIIPALIFSSFLLMPAAGIALLGVGFLLTVLSEQYLARYKPTCPGNIELTEDMYQAFLVNPSLETLHHQAEQQKRNESRHSVFETETTSEVVDTLEAIPPPNNIASL